MLMVCEHHQCPSQQNLRHSEYPHLFPLWLHQCYAVKL
jgi:hypothetical protein